MKNYEHIKLDVIVFEQSDVITLSNEDNLGGAPDGWAQ